MRRILTQVETDDLIKTLIDKVRRQKFSIVVGIANGGVHISSVIATALGLPHQAVSISHYDGEIKRDQSIVQKFFTFHVDHYDRCLIVDDLVDSGATVFTFQENFGLRNVDAVATLFYKPTSRYKPKFFVQETTDWVVFPWETD